MSAERPESRYRPVASKEELRALVEEDDARLRSRAFEPGGIHFLDAVERYLDLDRWGLRPTRLRISDVAVIYDSPRCRVKLLPSFERDPGEGSVLCHYGRLHAPDDDLYIDWQGERCIAWHSLGSGQYYWFLEGCTPQEAAQHSRRRSEWPVRLAFEATERGRTLHGIEWSVAYSGFRWEYFGERLFSLFDLRQPERWEALRRFLREYFRLLPDHPAMQDTSNGVSPWNVC